MLVNQFKEGTALYDPAQAASFFIYIMVRAPNEFKNMQMDQQGNTPLQLLFQFIGKVFENGAECNHDYTSMCGISLIMAVLEHLGEKDQLVTQNIHNINNMYIQEMARATNSNYKNMLIQGMMSNMWYDQQTTLASLKESENLDQVFNFIFSNMKSISKDFEIKRLVIGLASLTLQSEMPPPDELLPKSADIMQAIVQMCQKSIELKEKKHKKLKDAEAEEIKDAEGNVIYDDDEDVDEIKFANEDSDDEYDLWSQNDENSDDDDGELEDSTLYNVCEVLFVKEKFGLLETQNPDQFNYMTGFLNEQQKSQIMNLFQQAEQIKALEM